MPIVEGWSPASAEYHRRESLITRTILALSLCTTGVAPRTVSLVSMYLGSFVGGTKAPHGYEATCS